MAERVAEVSFQPENKGRISNDPAFVARFPSSGNGVCGHAGRNPWAEGAWGK